MRVHRAAVPAVLAACVLVTACGGSSAGPPGSSSSSSARKTAADVLPKVQSAVQSADSVHMAGTTTDGSQQIRFDLSFYGKSGLSGTITEKGGGFSVLTVNGESYIRADTAFLKFAKVPSSACAAICGKYIELPSSYASQITGSLSMSALFRQAFAKLPSAISKSEVFIPATYGGQPVLKFQHGGDTIDVASTGTPYPVLISAPGTIITFSEWDAVSAPTAPPASSVLNISQI
jgi:hypothetical protein